MVDKDPNFSNELLIPVGNNRIASLTSPKKKKAFHSRRESKISPISSPIRDKSKNGANYLRHHAIIEELANSPAVKE
jgi:hypothetical protein